MRDRAPVTSKEPDRAHVPRARAPQAGSPVAAVVDVPQAITEPDSPLAFRAGNLITLQRTLGNRAVQQLIAGTAALEESPEVTQDSDHEDAEGDAVFLVDESRDSEPLEPEGDENDTEGSVVPSEGAPAAVAVQRKPDGTQRGIVIQRAGRAQAIRDAFRGAGTKMAAFGGQVKQGAGEAWTKAGQKAGEAGTWLKGTAGPAMKRGAVATGKGIAKGAEYLTTVGIKDGTGVQSKAGKVAGNIAEGAFNALVGPVSPRWWYKAYTDITGIKKSDYGAGAMARVFQVLAITSQVVQKIGTTAGVLSLALGIAGAVLGSLMGAGAACALGSAVCGLIAFIASCTSFILQSVLTFGNLIKQGWSGIKGDADKKKRFINDLTSMIGSAVGVVGGGLGVNWGGGAGLFDSNSKSVLEGATSGLASSGNIDPVSGSVTGASSSGALAGQQFANFGMGQMFGSASDTISETAGTLAAKHDPSMSGRPFPLVQREGESEAKESGGQDPAALKSAVTQFLSGLAASREQDDSVADDMKGSVDAIDGVQATISKPMSSLGVPPPPGGAPADMPLDSGISMMPGKMEEAKQSLDSVESEASQTGMYKKKDSAKLEKAETDVAQAEGKLGISGEPAKKPNVFKRAKDWIVNKVLNIKTRIKKVAQAAKAKLVSVAMDVLGIKEQFEELKVTGAEDRQSNIDTIEDAAASTEAADEAEEKAEEFSSSLG